MSRELSRRYELRRFTDKSRCQELIGEKLDRWPWAVTKLWLLQKLIRTQNLNYCLQLKHPGCQQDLIILRRPSVRLNKSSNLFRAQSSLGSIILFGVDDSYSLSRARR